MHALDMNQFYQDQIKRIMFENGLDQKFGAEIKNCATLIEVFQAVSKRGAKHVAVLSETSEPITDMFCYIKEQLVTNKTVPLALFFEKEEVSTFYA